MYVGCTYRAFVLTDLTIRVLAIAEWPTGAQTSQPWPATAICMAPIQFDEIDCKILNALQEHARISNVDLADQVGLSPAPCLRRVQALEARGVIRKYVTLLDPLTVDRGVAVFVQISLDRRVRGQLDAFEQAVARQPEVVECYLMTGDADYLLRVVVPNVAAYERFLKDSLARVVGLAGIKSSFALRQVKYSTALPLPGPATAELSRQDSPPPRKPPRRAFKHFDTGRTTTAAQLRRSLKAKR